MSDITNLSAADREVGGPGAEIPSLGTADGRPVNKKMLVIFAIVFILISVFLFMILSKVKNRNAVVAVKPEAELAVAMPAENERLVPPLVTPMNIPTAKVIEGVQGEQVDVGTLSTPQGALAIPLSSESGSKSIGPNSPTKVQTMPNRQVELSAILQVIEKRSKMGGSLMIDDSGARADASGASQKTAISAASASPIGTTTNQRGRLESVVPARLTSPPADLAGIAAAALDTARASYGGGRTGNVGQSAVRTETNPPLDLSSMIDSRNFGARGKSDGAIEALRLTTDKNYLVPRGSNISCVLNTRLVSDISGQTSCTITTNVYSMNGAYRLIPKGSTLSGSYRSGSSDNERLAVIWDRILTPDGIDVTISDPGTDPLGGTGVPGEFDEHWGRKLSTAFLVSLVGDIFKLSAALYAPTITTITTDPSGVSKETKTPYQSVTVDTLSKIPAQITAKTLATPGTITIAQGQLVNVTTTRDIDFRAARLNR